MVSKTQDNPILSDGGITHGHQAEKAWEEVDPAFRRSSQYVSDYYQELLGEKGILISMNREGNSWDNTLMESFYRTLKVELIDPKKV